MKKQLLILTVAALLINSAGLAAPRVLADITADEEYSQIDTSADSEENTAESAEEDSAEENSAKEDSAEEEYAEEENEDADVESEDNGDSEEDDESEDNDDSDDSDTESEDNSDSEEDEDADVELEDNGDSDEDEDADVELEDNGDSENNTEDNTEEDTNTSTDSGSSSTVMGKPTNGNPGSGNTTSIIGSSSTISSIIASTAVANPFTDVSESDWFYGYVMNVYKNGIFTGTTDTTFAPYSSMTRSMLVTTLYRYAGSPAVSSETGFSDVAAGSWYSSAVAWAADNGIVTGFTDNTFAPDESITREQLAVIMHRYAVLNGADTTLGDLSVYADSDSVSDWARDSFAWATANRIISGREGGILDPHGTATRAEAAAIFVRVNSLF